MSFKQKVASRYQVTAKEEIFKVYEPSQLKSKELKCKEVDLEQCLRKLIGVPNNYDSKLEQVKKGSWVFRAGGKDYSVTKYYGY